MQGAKNVVSLGFVLSQFLDFIQLIRTVVPSMNCYLSVSPTDTRSVCWSAKVNFASLNAWRSLMV